MASPQSEHDNLVAKLRSSQYVLAVVGAGLSRPSGLPTFRDDSWFWDRPVEETATEAAFERDPVYVWSLYERLRVLSSAAGPNAGHLALARLAEAKPGMLTVSQNIDDLLPRAGHSELQLANLHGSVFTVRCSSESCRSEEPNTGQVSGMIRKATSKVSTGPETVLLDPSVLSALACPSCKSGKLRPGVCWFGESLPKNALTKVERWFDTIPRVDLVLVIGTDRHPFVSEAQGMGAEVAYFNFFEEDLDDTGDAWFVDGDASQTLPWIVDQALRPPSTLDPACLYQHGNS